MISKPFKRYVFTFFLTISSLLVVAIAALYFLIATPLGGRLLVHYLLLQSAQAGSVDVESFTGNLKSGLILKNVHIQNCPMLGIGTRMNVQRLDVRLPVVDLSKIQATIFNGRLDLPNSDPFLFQGTIIDGKIKGDVEAQMVDVSVLLKAFVNSDLYKTVHGTVSSVKFNVSGDVQHPSVKGGFVGDKILYLDRVATQIFAKVDVTLNYFKDHWAMQGLVILEGGQVKIAKNEFDVDLGKVVFKDQLTNPDIDMRCSIIKDIYDIDMRIVGTVRHNKITAYSDPALSQESIFMLLGMGQWLPINSSALNFQNNAQSLGLKRQLGENLNFGYGFEQSSENFRGESNAIQFLQGQMSLSDGLSFNVEKTIAAYHEGDRYNKYEPRKENESKLYLKYQNAF